MTVFRWILAAIFLCLWAAVAWANASIVLTPVKEGERRPSMVMIMGAVFAALGLKALPIGGPAAARACFWIWLGLSLLDAGSLGMLPLFLISALTGGLKQEKP